MKFILQRINDDLLLDISIEEFQLYSILNTIIHKIIICHRLQNLTLEETNHRICRIVNLHCVNSTRSTKNFLRNIIKKQLNTQQYEQLHIKLIYSLLSVGAQLTSENNNLLEHIYMTKIDPDLEKLAKKIISKVSSDTEPKKTTEERFGSVILILMVISIIISLVRVIQECNKSKLSTLNNHNQASIMQEEIKNVCIKKTWLNQLRLSRIIRQNMSKEDNKKYGASLRDAILNSGSDITQKESLALVNAINT